MSRLQQLEFSGNAPLPEELAAYLGGRIAQGIYRPGDKLPPERELAARFEVSRKTVRLALEEIERQGFIYRRVGKGTFVKRGAGARRDGGAGRSSIALISFKYTNPYSDGLISHLFGGMQGVFERNGCDLAVRTLGAAAGEKDRDAACNRVVDQITADRPDGVIFAAEPTREAIRRLSEVCPVLQAGYFIEGEGVGYVGADMLDGMGKAVRFLNSMGHLGIALVAHSIDEYEMFPTIAARVDVYRQVMEDMGLGDRIRVMGVDDLHVALEPGFGHTAVIATSTQLARRILSGARERGVRMPEDLSLVGYDDAGIGEGTTPRYTSMRHLSERMGQLAAEKLLGVIDGSVTPPVELTMPAELIVRESCAPPRDG